MAVAITGDMAQADAVSVEPLRTICAFCDSPVLVAVVPAVERYGRGALLVTAEPFEWEPRAECQSCAWTRNRTGRLVDCPRCDGSGYIGERRPAGPMLAVDVAWSDEGRVRLLAASTRRRKGEALHPLHSCLTDLDRPAIVPLTPEHERQAA